VVEPAQSARGGIADTMVDLAAPYAQFVAWMSLDTDDQAAAPARYDRARDRALEIGDVNMATTTLSVKAHQAWSAGNARRTVRLAEAARRHDGRVSPGVRGMAMCFYDETWFRLQRGMTELHLSNWPKAADLPASGLASLPASYRRDRAQYGSCAAKAHTDGNGPAAQTVRESSMIRPSMVCQDGDR
jgi:hypothetical protein